MLDDDEVEQEEVEEYEIAQEQELGLMCGPQQSSQHNAAGGGEGEVKTCTRLV